MDDYLAQCYLAHNTNYALGENNIYIYIYINTHSSDTFYKNNCLNHSFITNSSNDLPLSLQAFYFDMPPAWRERFVQAGHSQPLANQAALLHYF